MNLGDISPIDGLDNKQVVSALNATTIISLSDLGGRILYANDMFSTISGYSKEELIGQNHRIVNSGHHSKEFWMLLWKTISSGKTWRGELKNKKKNGDYYWVYTIICPQFNAKNEVHSYLSFRYDITEKKNLEMMLVDEKNTSLHLGKLAEIGELASSVAHEINNPLTIINGNFTFIKKKFNDKFGQNDDFIKHRDAIDKSISRIVKIVKSLMDFSYKDQNGSLPENCTAQQIVETSLALVSEKIKSERIDLKILMPTENTFVYCNPGQIEQVLINLILNAAYELRKIDNKWLEIEVKKVQDFVEFSVKDSGLGIPKEFQDKLMRPFFTTKPIGKGTGLGLSICKKIIEDHAGDFFTTPALEILDLFFCFLRPKILLSGL